MTLQQQQQGQMLPRSATFLPLAALPCLPMALAALSAETLLAFSFSTGLGVVLLSLSIIAHGVVGILPTHTILEPMKPVLASDNGSALGTTFPALALAATLVAVLAVVPLLIAAVADGVWATFQRQGGLCTLALPLAGTPALRPAPFGARRQHRAHEPPLLLPVPRRRALQEAEGALRVHRRRAHVPQELHHVDVAHARGELDRQLAASRGRRGVGAGGEERGHDVHVAAGRRDVQGGAAGADAVEVRVRAHVHVRARRDRRLAGRVVAAHGRVEERGVRLVQHDAQGLLRLPGPPLLLVLACVGQACWRLPGLDHPSGLVSGPALSPALAQRLVRLGQDDALRRDLEVQLPQDRGRPVLRARLVAAAALLVRGAAGGPALCAHRPRWMLRLLLAPAGRLSTSVGGGGRSVRLRRLRILR
mmetsp:Transcript_124662/g.302758  ORF Transcript_124662/g.302758 Transcript_124662/m.302758 type:complete len:420 (-) Transcript_124662:116-1375(-)